MSLMRAVTVGLLTLIASSWIQHPRLEAEQHELAPAAKPRRTDLLGDPLPPGAIARFGSSRLRHHERVTGVDVTPDGKTIVSVGDDQLVRFWDLDSGKQLRTIRWKEDASLGNLAITPNGKRVLVCVGKTVEVLDYASGIKVETLTGHDAEIGCLAMNQDGTILATGSRDKTIRLWDAATGKPLLRLKGHDFPVSCLAFSPDGKLLASGAAPNEKWDVLNPVKLWNVQTGKQARQFDGPVADVTGVAFGMEGRQLFLAGALFEPYVFDIATGKRLLSPVGRTITNLAVSRNGHFLAFEQTCCIHVFDSRGGKKLSQITSEKIRRGPMAFTPDGKSLITSAAGGEAIRIWDVATGKERRLLPGHHHSVLAIMFSPDGKTIASGGEDGSVRLWEPQTGRELKVLMRDPLYVPRRVAYSPDGKKLVTVEQVSQAKRCELAAGNIDIVPVEENRCRLWDITTARELHLLGKFHFLDGYPSVAFTRDSGRVLTLDLDAIRIWDVANRIEQLPLRKRGGTFHRLAVAPDEQLVAVAGYLENEQRAAKVMPILLLDAKNGKMIHAFLPDCGPIKCLEFAPDGRTLASAGYDNAIRLWDVQSKAQLRTISCGFDPSCLRFSPDGKLIAVSPGVGVYEVVTGARVHGFSGHDDTVNAVAFSPDGRLLASAGQDDCVYVWDVFAQGNNLKWAPDHVWSALGSENPTKAYQAMCVLVASSVDGVAILSKRVKAEPARNVGRIRRLVANLDNPIFAIRETATHELATLAGLAEPELRQVAQDPRSPEVNKRAQELLNALPFVAMSPNQVRQLRSIQVLELIGSVEARCLLQILATGEPLAAQTIDARGALKRLAVRAH